MGNLRIFLKAVRFTFRNRNRTISFILIYMALSMFIIFFATTFSTYTHEDLLKRKGVVLKQRNYELVTTDNPVLNNFTEKLHDNPLVENLLVYHYVNLGDEVRIFEVHKEQPWMFTLVNPRSLKNGHFILHENEILIPQGVMLSLNASVPNAFAEITPTRGDKITFHLADNSSMTLTVAGEVDPTLLVKQERDWMFMESASFNRLVESMNITSYVYEISVTVKGSVFIDEAYDNKAKLAGDIKQLYQNTPQSSTYFDDPNFFEENIDILKEEKNKDIGIFAAGLGIAILLALIYAMIITKFRKNEIAVLKTVGYSGWNIRMALFGEIITVSFIGFIIGVFLIQSYLIYSSKSLVTSILSLTSLGLSFGIVVLLDFPTLALASRGLLKIKPLEVFREV